MLHLKYVITAMLYKIIDFNILRAGQKIHRWNSLLSDTLKIMY